MPDMICRRPEQSVILKGCVKAAIIHTWQQSKFRLLNVTVCEINSISAKGLNRGKPSMEGIPTPRLPS